MKRALHLDIMEGFRILPFKIQTKYLQNFNWKKKQHNTHTTEVNRFGLRDFSFVVLREEYEDES